MRKPVDIMVLMLNSQVGPLFICFHVNNRLFLGVKLPANQHHDKKSINTKQPSRQYVLEMGIQG